MVAIIGSSKPFSILFHDHKFWLVINEKELRIIILKIINKKGKAITKNKLKKIIKKSTTYVTLSANDIKIEKEKILINGATITLV